MSKYTQIANILEKIKNKIDVDDYNQLASLIVETYNEHNEYTRIYGETEELLGIKMMLEEQVSDLRDKLENDKN
jgi:hypothetical protein